MICLKRSSTLIRSGPPKIFFTIMPSYKLSVTLFIIILAIALAIIFKEQKSRRYVLVAIIFGMIGDYFMTLQAGNWKVIAGGSAFAVEHAIFIVMFIKMFKEQKLKIFNKWFILSLGIFGVSLVIFEALTFALVPQPNIILASLLPIYMLVICINMGFNFSYSFQRKGTFYLFALGIFVFYISDIFVFLGITKVTQSLSDVVWLFYPIGQLLMVLFCDKLEKEEQTK